MPGTRRHSLEIIESPSGIHADLIPSMMRRAAEVVTDEGAFPTDQLNNRDAFTGSSGGDDPTDSGLKYRAGDLYS